MVITLVIQLVENAPEILTGLGIHSVGWFIQNQQSRPGNQGAG